MRFGSVSLVGVCTNIEKSDNLVHDIVFESVYSSRVPSFQKLQDLHIF